MGISSGTTRLFDSDSAEKLLGDETIALKQYFQGRTIHYSEIYKCFFGEAAPRELLPYLIMGLGKEGQDKIYFNYDDLIYLLAVLKYAGKEHKGKFFFQMFGTETVSLGAIQKFGREIGTICEDLKMIRHEFLAMGKEEVNLKTFIELFIKLYYHNTIFNWMAHIIKPYKEMEDAIENSRIDSRLFTHKARELFPAEIEQFLAKRKIAPEQIEGYQASFSFLKSKSLLSSTHILSLFKKNRIGEPFISQFGKLMSSKGKLTFRSFLAFLSPFCEISLVDKRNRMLFKLFAEPDKKFIKTEKAVEMASSWVTNSEKLKAFSEKIRPLRRIQKEDFLKLAQKETILMELDKLYYMPYIDLNFPPESSDREKKCVENLLNNKVSLEQYINDCLQVGDKFSLISTSFWKAWTSKVGWGGQSKGGDISEEIIIEVPSEKGFLRKLDCTLSYPESCLFVPERVYLAFRKWYPGNVGNVPVTRKVIKYPFTTENKKLVNPNEIKMDKHNTHFSQRVGKDIKELLVNKYFFNGFRIQDDGKFPAFPTYSLWEWVRGEKKETPYFIEIYCSPKKTVETLLRKIKKALVTEKGSNLKTHLYIGSILVDSCEYVVTLEQYFASRGEIEQIVYIEVALPNGVWPTSLAKKSAIKAFKPITNGLTNLGNTCYINAALQCLFNIPFMREYFVSNSSIHYWRKHVNLFNFRFNRKGVFVEAFAKLGELIWQAPEPAINPREFRDTISKFNEDFKRKDQQDTQEFLGFLLDELHEELNLVINKKAYLYPESCGRKPGELAQEFWSLNLLRNWSLITFSFMGQLGSELNCKHCKYASWTFEPYNMLSLPIPWSNSQTISVVFVPLSNHLKQQLLKESSKEVPVQYITLFVKKNATIADISNQLRSIPELLLERSARFSRIEFCKIIKHKISQIYKPSHKIEFLESLGNAKELFAIEILTQEGRKIINPTKTICFFKNTLAIEEEKEETALTTQISSNFDSEKKYQLYNPNLLKQSLAYRTRVKYYSEFFVNIINRIVLENPRHIWKKFDAQIVGNPTLLLVNSKMTNYDLYEQIHEVTTAYLEQKSPYLLQKNSWWNNSTLSKKPFVLRHVCSQGNYCEKCSWLDPCLGCIILPDKNEISLDYESNIAVDWNLDVYQQDYHKITEIIHHDSVKRAVQTINTPIDLTQLFNSFFNTEDIPECKCENCHEVSPRYKALSIFKLPNVLIIHLKRYKQSASAKNNVKVIFPFEDFDMSSFVNSESEEKFDDAFYDLYAVINHYGSLSAGHYTASIRSGSSWYCYDDSRVYEISRADLNPASAYILFYLRKGLFSLATLFPKLGTAFPGCPVNTKLGVQGFIKEIRTSEDVKNNYSRYVIKSFTSNLLMFIGEDDIDWEDHDKRMKILKNKIAESRKIQEQNVQEKPEKQNETTCIII